MNLPYDWIAPDWPAPPRVRACTTTRLGGVSEPPFDSLNLADHVGDDPARVAANQARLMELLRLPAAPVWLRQVHGVQVCNATVCATRELCEADASTSTEAGVVCAVLSADCLPVLFCTRDGRQVAAAHVGWRGLVNGVLEATLQAMAVRGGEVLAWLGPAIGPQAFEVGPEVREAFLSHDPWCGDAFVAARQGHWWADLYRLARRRLQAQGVKRIYGGGWCTWSDPQRFYSYRRDGDTGRMASLIWIAPE
ncbi:MAG: hypothetical protein A2V90_03990 [Gammaproteobacteria bacterium RBG_16_57_12]|nr:MAG: hypothetical protein A2V90_03990 [Gammaproteobacteria bacterium RBG_16_57_12]